MASPPSVRTSPARLGVGAFLALVIGVGGLAGCHSGAKPQATGDTATTLSPATVKFLAKAKELGVLGPDDEILLLALDYCGLARRGPIDDAVATNFHGFSPGDRMQASLVLSAAGSDLCPDQAPALARAASEVLTVS